MTDDPDKKDKPEPWRPGGKTKRGASKRSSAKKAMKKAAGK
jgi:hypothetical protein